MFDISWLATIKNCTTPSSGSSSLKNNVRFFSIVSFEPTSGSISNQIPNVPLLKAIPVTSSKYSYKSKSASGIAPLVSMAIASSMFFIGSKTLSPGSLNPV